MMRHHSCDYAVVYGTLDLKIRRVLAGPDLITGGLRAGSFPSLAVDREVRETWSTSTMLDASFEDGGACMQESESDPRLGTSKAPGPQSMASHWNWILPTR